ncbi:hypothetical protein ACFRJ1_07935 [Streptomyces sp. NPDC056773]|uniref:hypothetical protein n=1 Tax=unclassified Streptomyces TaxID=2593676 RepID=UPI0036D11C39
MSNRATFLVDRRRYWSSFGAVGLDLDLLAGPRAFVPFAEDHTEADGSPWYDDDMCEAGALVDTEAKVLLLFAWEGVFASTRTRAAAFELLRHAWPGWRVRWLYDGQRGLRAYVGAEPCRYPGRVDISPVVEPGDPDLAEPDPSVLVVTVGGRCHVLGMVGEHPVDEGPALLERLAGEPAHAGYSGACEGGVHVDPRLRRVGWWHTTRQPWLAEVGERWPGWTVEFWEDRWAEHVRRAPVLDVREPDRAAALAEVRDAALARWAGSRRDVRAAVRAAAPRALIGGGLAPALAATSAAEAREVIIRAHAVTL